MTDALEALSPPAALLSNLLGKEKKHVLSALDWGVRDWDGMSRLCLSQHQEGSEDTAVTRDREQELPRYRSTLAAPGEKAALVITLESNQRDGSACWAYPQRADVRV